MRVTLALHTSDLARIASSTKNTSQTATSPETSVSSGAPRAKRGTRSSSDDESEEGGRTKHVATNNTSGRVEAVVPFGSGKPKLFADGVGINLSEAVSANRAPALSSSRGRSSTVKE